MSVLEVNYCEVSVSECVCQLHITFWHEHCSVEQEAPAALPVCLLQLKACELSTLRRKYVSLFMCKPRKLSSSAPRLMHAD